MLLRFKKFNKSSYRCLKCEFSPTQLYFLKLKGQHHNSFFFFFFKTVATGWYYLLFMSSPQPVTTSSCVQYWCNTGVTVYSVAAYRGSYLVIQTVTQATSISFLTGSARGKSVQVQWSGPLQADLLSAVSLC